MSRFQAQWLMRRLWHSHRQRHCLLRHHHLGLLYQKLCLLRLQRPWYHRDLDQSGQSEWALAHAVEQRRNYLRRSGGFKLVSGPDTFAIAVCTCVHSGASKRMRTSESCTFHARNIHRIREDARTLLGCDADRSLLCAGAVTPPIAKTADVCADEAIRHIWGWRTAAEHPESHYSGFYRNSA